VPPAPPAVSVLLPVRDGARFLPDALESVLSQTLADLELLVVDDGSTDRTPEILRDWAARDPRLTVLRQAPLGIVAALEAARAAARGRFLARMDGDDVSLPRRLEAQRALLEASPELVGCGCGVEYFPPEAVRGGARRYETWINGVVTPEQIERSLFVECPLAHPTFFLRAAAVEAVGGYRDAGWAEDYDLLLRLWAAGGRLGKVPEVLHRWRERPERLSRTHPRYAPEAFLACKAHYLAETVLAGCDGVVIWGAGPVGKAVSRAVRAHGARLEAFVELDPRKIGQEIHGAPVVDTERGLAMRRAYHLAAVGQEGARERLRELLAGAGYAPVREFVAVA